MIKANFHINMIQQNPLRTHVQQIKFINYHLQTTVINNNNKLARHIMNRRRGISLIEEDDEKITEEMLPFSRQCQGSDQTLKSLETSCYCYFEISRILVKQNRSKQGYSKNKSEFFSKLEIRAKQKKTTVAKESKI